MECNICGIQIDSVEEAVDQGWAPYFYEGEIEHGPVCSSCAEKLIRLGEDGELELKEEYQGKIIYQGGDYMYKEPKKDLVIGIAFSDTEEVGSS